MQKKLIKRLLSKSSLVFSILLVSGILAGTAIGAFMHQPLPASNQDLTSTD